ncbi:hypothetical protein C8Q76DRAFT_483588 [Earliella scabrosa]|nr:hypothetical protein C8Q76DRAFT_483588 [Earliella scabrosa]
MHAQTMGRQAPRRRDGAEVNPCPDILGLIPDPLARTDLSCLPARPRGDARPVPSCPVCAWLPDSSMNGHAAVASRGHRHVVRFSRPLSPRDGASRPVSGRPVHPRKATERHSRVCGVGDIIRES